MDLLCSAGQDCCNLWRCWHRNMFSGASSGGAALPGTGTLWRCACLFLPPLCVRAGAHFGEGPRGGVCTVALLSEQAGGLLLGWGCRCAPPPAPAPQGEARSQVAGAAEAGLCPTARGCCNHVVCLWRLVGCAAGFVVLLRNWDAASHVGVAETSGSGQLWDGVSSGAAPWCFPSDWIVPLLVQPCTGGHWGWMASLASG